MNYFLAGLLIGLIPCLLVNKWWADLYDETCEEWFEICQLLLKDQTIKIYKSEEDKR